MTLAELRKALPGWSVKAWQDDFGGGDWWMTLAEYENEIEPECGPHYRRWYYRQNIEAHAVGPTRKAAVEALAAKLAEMGVL